MALWVSVFVGAPALWVPRVFYWAAMCHCSHQGAAKGSSSKGAACFCGGGGKQEGVEEAQPGCSRPAQESGLGSWPCTNSCTTQASGSPVHGVWVFSNAELRRG